MPEDRRLAAIMFTDIVGYTALMGSDEDKAFQLLRKNRELQRPLIKKYRGEWLKEMGDGILASFSTASDAVRCAGEIQYEAKKAGIPLRIGVHSGEVVFEGGDVLGDGVNVASRLEELAEEGCINISGAVYKDIKNKAGITAEFVEEKTLKNVDEPVKVYRVKCEESEEEVLPTKTTNKRTYYIIGGVLVLIVAFVLIWFLYPRQQVVVEDVELEKSIAVLPFKDLSAEMNNQYFCDGIMEGILNHLSKIKDLRVASRSSTEKYRENIPSAQQMAEELNVTYLLEASVFKSEDKIRVTAQLINATRDEHLWSEQYDSELEDVFVVMSDISQEVASEVKVAILPEVKERIEALPTENLKAYDLYLKGKEFWSRYWKLGYDADRRSGIQLFQQAIELDSLFADAYIPLGNLVAYQLFLEETSLEAVFEESFNDTMLYYINKALSINPDLADAYYLLGCHYYQIFGNYAKGIEMHKKAIKLNPNDGDSRWRLGLYNYEKGEYIESLKAYKIMRETSLRTTKLSKGGIYVGNVYHSICDFQKADDAYTEYADLNPLNGYSMLCWLAESRGEWEKMKTYIDNLCAIDSGYYCLQQLGNYYMHTENFEEAIKCYTRFKDLALKFDFWGRFKYPYYPYAYMLYKVGRIEQANELFDECINLGLNCLQLERRCDDNTQVRYRLAGIYAFRGEKEKAYQLLQEMENEVFHGDLVWYMQVDPHFESLWQDEEFKQIIQRQEKKYADIRAEIDRLEEEGLL